MSPARKGCARAVLGRRLRRSDRDFLPGPVFWSLGILLPIALVAGGIYCLHTDEFFLNVYRGDGFTVSGDATDGVGILAIGLALLAHFGVFWRFFPSLRPIGTWGMIAGAVAVVVGLVVAVA
ncbi:MAG: hypothetical protein ACYTDY_06150 [Planctomycetota bacterium]|jgi:hypothetical protein